MTKINEMLLLDCSGVHCQMAFGVPLEVALENVKRICVSPLGPAEVLLTAAEAVFGG